MSARDIHFHTGILFPFDFIGQILIMHFYFILKHLINVDLMFVRNPYCIILLFINLSPY